MVNCSDRGMRLATGRTEQINRIKTYPLSITRAATSSVERDQSVNENSDEQMASREVVVGGGGVKGGVDNGRKAAEVS